MRGPPAGGDDLLHYITRRTGPPRTVCSGREGCDGREDEGQEGQEGQRREVRGWEGRRREGQRTGIKQGSEGRNEEGDRGAADHAGSTPLPRPWEPFVPSSVASLLDLATLLAFVPLTCFCPLSFLSFVLPAVSFTPPATPPPAPRWLPDGPGRSRRGSAVRKG